MKKDNRMQQYRGLAYNSNINRDTRRFVKKYKDKIGKSLGATVEGMLSRRGQLILMVSGAGSGKTYVVLEMMAKLSMKAENENTRYIIAVPNRNQSNQNEKSDSLSKFQAKSVVGSSDGKRKVTVNVITEKIYSCVYDKALEVVEIIKSNGYEAVLVLDESHKMIADANFRKEAIANLEEACKTADQAIMMTATPRMCLEYYKYTDIYEMENSNQANNIKDFKIILSEDIRHTLIEEIKKVKDKTITVTEWVEVWEDTLVPVTPQTLLEMLEATKYETKKIRTEDRSYDVEKKMKVVVRLNSIEEIDVYMKILEEEGITSIKLTRKEKDDEIFKGIEEKSEIITDADVIFVTSILEAGVSLYNREMYLIEMLPSIRNFNHDNSVQFFARPRNLISGASIIIKDYYNDDLYSSILEVEKEKARLEERKVNELAVMQEYEKRKKDFSASKNMIEEMKKADYSRKYKNIVAKFETLKNKYMKEVNELASMELGHQMNRLSYMIKTRGENHARKFIKEDMVSQKMNNKSYVNLLHLDEENLKLMVDNKKVITKAFSELDKYIARYNPQMLLEYFEGKIFYDKISIEHSRVATAEQIQDARNLSKKMTEIKKEKNAVKAMKEEQARMMLLDEDFMKLIDDINDDNIRKENIDEYTDKFSIREILSYKNSKVAEKFIELNKVFDKEEVVVLLATRTIKDASIKNRYARYLKYVDDSVSYEDFIENMNMVPSEKETRYYKFSECADILERKHIADNINAVGRYQRGSKDKQSAIMDVVLPLKNKDGKMKTIRATREICLHTMIELVDRKAYKDAKMEKAINAIRKDAEKYGRKADLYSKANIKKLEQAYSSGNNNDAKMMNEISKIFNVSYDSRGNARINGVIKKFDMASIIFDIH